MFKKYLIGRQRKQKSLDPKQDVVLEMETNAAIGRIAMDSADKRERSSSAPIDQNLVQTFLAENILRRLYRFGYIFGKKLGEGTYGQVYECFFKQSGNSSPIRLAVKKVTPVMANRLTLSHFTKLNIETEKLTFLLTRHPNLIGIQNIWCEYKSIDDSYPEFVLFFMDIAERDLFSYLAQREQILGRPIEEPEVKYFMKQIVAGLEYLHSVRIAHLDLKPENVLLVTDSTSVYRGTEGYRAPEIDLCVPFDPFLADIYSLGMTLQFMIGFFEYEIVVYGIPPAKRKHEKNQ